MHLWTMWAQHEWMKKAELLDEIYEIEYEREFRTHLFWDRAKRSKTRIKFTLIHFLVLLLCACFSCIHIAVPNENSILNFSEYKQLKMIILNQNKTLAYFLEFSQHREKKLSRFVTFYVIDEQSYSLRQSFFLEFMSRLSEYKTSTKYSCNSDHFSHRRYA